VAVVLAVGCQLAFPLGDFDNGTPSDATAPDGDGVAPDAQDGRGVDVADAGAGGCDADLTSDPNNCSACGRTCLGAPCEAGLCVPNVVANVYPYAFTVGGGFVYYTAGDGNVYRVPGNGVGLQTLAMAQDRPGPIAVDGTNVYWANVGDGGTSGSIMRAGLDGTNIVTVVSGQANPLSLAINSAHIYWVASVPDGGVLRVPIDAGPDASAEMFVAGYDWPNTLAADESDIVWSWSGSIDAIMDSPVDGGATVMLTQVHGGLSALARSGADVYFTSGREVQHVGINGVPAAALATDTGQELGVAADGRGLFWTVYNISGEVRTCSAPLCPEQPHTLVPTYYPKGIVIDDQAVYWFSDKGTILRVAR
jgi:hypothetical protein